ncbi:MAG TPA: hypothetical protein VEI50_01915 [Nitrospiraceae bacterium]|jgi:hypothetical protein|nr:hypothetical protein [Nitrospiraceae bacterium]
MAKKTTAESDEARLKKKVAAQLTGHKSPEGDAALRTLRKRLKRVQRKRRARALRKKHATGKTSEVAAPAAG